MEENDILGLGIRRQIFKFILNYPGLHLRKLSRNLDEIIEAIYEIFPNPYHV